MCATASEKCLFAGARLPAFRVPAPVPIFIFALLGIMLSFMVSSHRALAATGELGLPVLTHPQHNPPTPEKIALGKKLFHDPRLSADGTVSCATCHIPARAFTDGLRVAKGIAGQLATRNTPTLLNVAFNESLFWDGRRVSLEEQAGDPFINAREHGFTTHAQLIAVIRRDHAYRRAFKRAFAVPPAAITPEHVALAIASFERTLLAADTPFDRYYYQHDKTALSPAAVRGLALFTGRAQCASCHHIGASSATFTDNQFHSLGVGYRKIEARLADITAQVVNADAPSADHRILSNADIAELGRFTVTRNPLDIATFRTPSLRNVALTAPYMHDGSLATLEEVLELELYYRGITSGRPLTLTAQEQSDLLAFLHALTSDHAIQRTVPAHRRPRQ